MTCVAATHAMAGPTTAIGVDTAGHEASTADLRGSVDGNRSVSMEVKAAC